MELQSEWSKKNKVDFCLESLKINRKYWWICNKGHEWEATLAKRLYSNQGCPYCSNRRVLSGFNDLQSQNPKLASMWDFDKNSTTPDKVYVLASKKVHWICEKGHSFSSSPATASKGSWCPYCSGRMAIPGQTDIATTDPELMNEWDFEKNTIEPSTVKRRSERKVWWKCKAHGHSWDGKPSDRVRKDGSYSGCPICLGKKVLVGFNDFKTKNPEVAKEWHPSKNTLLPSEVTQFSNKKVWWKCAHGHEWKASVEKRASGSSCPYCSHQRVTPGQTCVESVIPEIAAEWDYDKNHLPPSQVLAGSKKKFWWICDKGHHYKATPNSRRAGKGCPYCSGRKVLFGFNDAYSTFPEEVRNQFSPKNDFSLKECTASSHKKALWVCNKGHEWESAIYNIKAGCSCPTCSLSGTSVAEQEILSYVKSIVDCEVISRNKTVLGNREIDIYIPDLNIAIEYNGIYWHSESSGKDSRYHYDKWLRCKKQGIQLITVWEDDWKFKQDIVKSMLAHKLGVFHGDRVYARKTYVSQESASDVKQFCNKNHIQGFARGSLYLTLRSNENDELVAISTWRKVKDNLYLDRYCTSVSVPGGMGKLLKAAIMWAQGHSINRIVTFSNHEVSNGELYERLGFDNDGELSPDYSYIYDGMRRHKFGFRKIRFRNDPLLKFEEGLTENDLAAMNGIPRVWDCGKTRWIINFSEKNKQT